MNWAVQLWTCSLSTSSWPLLLCLLLSFLLALQTRYYPQILHLHEPMMLFFSSIYVLAKRRQWQKSPALSQRSGFQDVVGTIWPKLAPVNPLGWWKYAARIRPLVCKWTEFSLFLSFLLFFKLCKCLRCVVWRRHSQFCLWSSCGIECFYSECTPQSKAQKVPFKAEKSSKHSKDKED